MHAAEPALSGSGLEVPSCSVQHSVPLKTRNRHQLGPRQMRVLLTPGRSTEPPQRRFSSFFQTSHGEHGDLNTDLQPACPKRHAYFARIRPPHPAEPLCENCFVE